MIKFLFIKIIKSIITKKSFSFPRGLLGDQDAESSTSILIK